MRVLHEVRRYFATNLKAHLRRGLRVAGNRRSRQNASSMFEIRESNEEAAIRLKEDLKNLVTRCARLCCDDNQLRAKRVHSYRLRFRLRFCVHPEE